jgi:DNA-binding NarL/FixJ family response regulator
MAQGNSNKIISENLDIPVKTIERILNEVNKKFENRSKDFNPRVRLLATLVTKDLIDYEIDIQPRYISNLSDNLNRTLVLCATGFSNKAIAKIFGLSEKAIELRFSQLFDYFNVDTKNQGNSNPRVNLFISAYCRGNIKKSQIQKLLKESSQERIKEVFEKPENFLANLEEEYKFIG